MATYAYDDFQITFAPRPDGEYDMVATSPDGVAHQTLFKVPLSAEELEQAVLNIAAKRSRTARAGPTTREVGPAAAAAEMDAEQVGAALAAALFVDGIGAAYDAAREASNAAQRGLRLTLSLAAAPGLMSLPWEFLYRRPRFLASQRHSPLVRRLDTGRQTTPPGITSTVRILGVVSSPSDLSPLEVDVEKARVEQAVSKMVAAGRVDLDWLEPATPSLLRKALRDNSYHILHYVGHSSFTSHDEGAIYLENEAGLAVEVDNTVLANLLADQDSTLRLVVLNSCEGARTTLSDPYAGVATTLIDLGVPAVVAMQFEISDEAAILFADELYTNLIGRQDPIDAAVAEARKAIYVEIDRVEWATPVLFVRDPAVQLFDFRVPVASLPPPPPPGVLDDRGDDGPDTGRVAPVGQRIGDSGPVDVIVPVTKRERSTPDDASGTQADDAIRMEPPHAFATVVSPHLGGGTSKKAMAVVAGLIAAVTVGVVVIATNGDDTKSTADTTAAATVAPIVTDPATTFGNAATTAPATTNPTATPIARPRTGYLSVQVLEPDGETHLYPVDLASGRIGKITDRAGVTDTQGVWDRSTNRVAFTRVDATQGAGSMLKYVVPGRFDSADQGKVVAPLIPWSVGTYDHAPAWAVEGALFYARTDGCVPSATCADELRRAEFTASPDGAGFLDVLTVTPGTDRTIVARIVGVTAVVADPTDADRAVVAASDGLWVADVGRVPQLIAPGVVATTLAFTPDGQFLVAISESANGQQFDVFTPTGDRIGSGPIVGDNPGIRFVSITGDESGRTLLALSVSTEDASSAVVTRLRVDDDGGVGVVQILPILNLPDLGEAQAIGL